MSYDFENNTWSNLPDVPLVSESINDVTCTIHFNKIGQARHCQATGKQENPTRFPLNDEKLPFMTALLA